MRHPAWLSLAPFAGVQVEEEPRSQRPTLVGVGASRPPPSVPPPRPTHTLSARLVFAAHFDVIGPAEPILAAVGDDVELPCHLSPNVSAERMELRWFRRKVAAAVLVRRDGREQAGEQVPEYRGRATLVDHDIAAGRVAVRIHRVRASDDGEYRCFFRQDGNYEEASVHLKVAGERAGFGFLWSRPGGVRFPMALRLWKPPGALPKSRLGWKRLAGLEWEVTPRVFESGDRACPMLFIS